MFIPRKGKTPPYTYEGFPSERSVDCYPTKKGPTRLETKSTTKLFRGERIVNVDRVGEPSYVLLKEVGKNFYVNKDCRSQ